jgi:peptidoglycan biosynthesis protein MviN/MurJ (putative lipid II flippase)
MSDAFWTAFWANFPLVLTALGSLATVFVTLYNGLQSKKRSAAVSEKVESIHETMLNSGAFTQSDMAKLAEDK